MKPFLIAFWIGVFGSSCAATQVVAQESGDSRPIQGTSTADWSVEVVTKDLDYPWDIARAGDPILLTEKAGNIVVIENGQQRRYALQTSDPIVDESGAGLLGMALSRDFVQSGVAYFYHSYRSDAGLTNKVIQARFDGNAWRETRVLLAGIPGHRLYNGGAIAIRPDGHLYVTTGWTGQPRAAAGPEQPGRQGAAHDAGWPGAAGQPLLGLAGLFLWPSQSAGHGVEPGRRVVRGRAWRVRPRRDQPAGRV